MDLTFYFILNTCRAHRKRQPNFTESTCSLCMREVCFAVCKSQGSGSPGNHSCSFSTSRLFSSCQGPALYLPVGSCDGVWLSHLLSWNGSVPSAKTLLVALLSHYIVRFVTLVATQWMGEFHTVSSYTRTRGPSKIQSSHTDRNRTGPF